VTCAALCWAASGSAGKVLLLGSMTPAALVQVRVTLASAILGLFFLFFRPNVLLVRSSDMWLLGSVGILMSLVQFTYFYAISLMHVMSAVLLQYMAPILVALFAVVFWKERLTAFKVCALVLALVGCYFVVGGYDLQILDMNRLGIVAGLASAAFYGAYALVGEKLMHIYRPWTVAFYALLVSTLVWNAVHSPFAFLTEHYTAHDWQLILFVVLVGTIAPFGLYFVGINYVRSTQAMIAATLEPVASGIIAYWFLDEHVGIMQIVGAILVVAGIVLLQLRQEKDMMAPESVRSERGT